MLQYGHVIETDSYRGRGRDRSHYTLFRLPHCRSKRYGDGDSEAPVYYECGSGYMTAANDPKDFVQTTACAIIIDLKSELRRWVAASTYGLDD